MKAFADKSAQADHRAATAHRKQSSLAKSGPGRAQTAQFQAIADASPGVRRLAGMQANVDGSPAMAVQPKQGGAAAPATAQRANTTGLPDRLKTGVEHLSGLSMDDVTVHYNSSKPAQLQALAYAQGTDIHVGPGQHRHLPHEAWHVVQQKQGRVTANRQMRGVAVNTDAALEREADVMGEKANQGGGTQLTAAPAAAGAVSGAVVQARLGFEIEMLALVDIGGRPIPEKAMLGTAGGNNVEMTVDHGPAVDAPTPTAAHRANFSVPGFAPAVGAAPPGPLLLGPYDTPAGTQTRMSYPVGAPPPAADPRQVLSMLNLDWATWAPGTVAIDRTRTQNPDNRPFAQIDTLIRDYRRLFDNWETGAAQVILAGVGAQIAQWNAVNPNANTRLARGDSNQRRTQRFNTAQAALQVLAADVAAHQAMWTANPAPPGGMQRQYRSPVGGGGMGPWGAAHPRFQPHEGMGRDRYASILEIVTPGAAGFEPETGAGRANIIGAMTDAVNLAAAIEAATNNFTQRVRLSTVATVNNVTNPDIFVGNTQQPNQTTDASLQATMAIDLAQIASFIKSTIASFWLPQQEFALKHDSDPTDLTQPRRAVSEMARSPLVAQQIIRNRLAPAFAGGWAGNPTHLRGLFTLICQYLLMGRHSLHGGTWALDKNIVPLLSRNDLGSVVFNELVPPAEQALVAANPVAVRNAILAETGRVAGSAVFNRAADDLAPAGAAPYNLSNTQFIDNILAGNNDGLTGHLGGFRQFAHGESVDPAGARGGDYHRGGAAQREGAIFELRNMIPAEALNLPTDRFPRGRWVGLATHMVDMLAALNTRTVAQSARDTRFRQASGALHDEGANW